MLTHDEINKALHEVDPTAKVVFVLHDEIEIVCAEECKDAVHRRLSELTFAHFQKEHAAEVTWCDVWAETTRRQPAKVDTHPT